MIYKEYKGLSKLYLKQNKKMSFFVFVLLLAALISSSSGSEPVVEELYEDEVEPLIIDQEGKYFN